MKNLNLYLGTLLELKLCKSDIRDKRYLSDPDFLIFFFNPDSVDPDFNPEFLNPDFLSGKFNPIFSIRILIKHLLGPGSS